MSRGQKYTYADDKGCSFWSNCLTCPFPKCRNDYFEHGQTKAERRIRVAEMARDGFTPEQIVEASYGFGAIRAEEVEEWLAA